MGLVSFFLFVSLLWLMLHGIRRMLSRPRRSLSLEPFSVSRLFPSSASASASASSSAIWSNSRSGGSSLGTGLNRRRTVVAGSTRLHLTSLTLRLDTERLNALPHRALANLGAVPPSVHGQGTGTRRYSGILPLSAGDSSRITRQTNRLRKRRRMVEGFYDAGTLFAVCAMVFAILLLVLGAKQLVGKLGAVKDASSAVATAASGSGVDTCEDVGGVCAADFANAGTRTLRKRELGTGETNVGKTSSWGPDITPLVSELGKLLSISPDCMRIRGLTCSLSSADPRRHRPTLPSPAPPSRTPILPNDPRSRARLSRCPLAPHASQHRSPTPLPLPSRCIRRPTLCLPRALHGKHTSRP